MPVGNAAAKPRLDASAVKANFERQQSQVGDPAHTSAEVIYWNDVVGFNDLWDHTDAVDSSTVQITLKAPNGSFLLDLALFPFAWVMAAIGQTGRMTVWARRTDR